MGLLDNVLGSVMGNAPSGGSNSAVQQALQGLLQQHGGLSGLIGVLSQGGLAQQVQSWVGTGANLPVSAEQLLSALGNGPISQVAGHLGVNTQQAGGMLAQILPHVIDHLTPNGQLPAGATQLPSANVLGAALNSLFGHI